MKMLSIYHLLDPSSQYPSQSLQSRDEPLSDHYSFKLSEIAYTWLSHL